MGAFSTRLVRARDADEALHAGISPTDLRTLAPGQALLARPGERTALVCVPDTPCHLDAPGRSATSGWGIPSPATASGINAVQEGASGAAPTQAGAAELGDPYAVDPQMGQAPAPGAGASEAFGAGY